MFGGNTLKNPEFICLHTVKWFQVFPSNMKNCYINLSKKIWKKKKEEKKRQESFLKTYSIYTISMYTDQFLISNSSDCSPKFPLKFLFIISEIIQLKNVLLN